MEDKPKPTIEAPSDAVVKITRTTICGTDLHIMKGDVPAVTNGRILGHKGVGVVDEVGVAISAFKKGDAVIISCITSCARCDACKKGMYSHCANGGWILGNTIDGTQAENVRIPFADTSLYPVPKGGDEDVLTMLSDILPTGFECGVLSAAVKPGDQVAIVGAGPIGLAALINAQLYSPSEIIMIDLDDHGRDDEGLRYLRGRRQEQGPEGDHSFPVSRWSMGLRSSANLAPASSARFHLRAEVRRVDVTDLPAPLLRGASLQKAIIVSHGDARGIFQRALRRRSGRENGATGGTTCSDAGTTLLSACACARGNLRPPLWRNKCMAALS